MYLSLLYPGPLKLIISNVNHSNGRVAGNSYCRLQEICCVCFAIKQVLHLILSGARSLVNSVSSTLLMYSGSCSIALNPAWPSILCHFKAVALTSLYWLHRVTYQ